MSVCVCDALEALLATVVEMLHCPTLLSGDSGGGADRRIDEWMGSGGLMVGWMEERNSGKSREGKLCLFQSYVNQSSSVLT